MIEYMRGRIAIIQGHRDGESRHLLQATANAYAEGAAVAGNEMRRVEVASLEFPLLRTRAIPAGSQGGAIKGGSKARFYTWLLIPINAPTAWPCYANLATVQCEFFKDRTTELIVKTWREAK